MTGGHPEVSDRGPIERPKIWPSTWEVDVENAHDRWTVGIPQNTLLKQQLAQYKTQKLQAPTGYQAQSPGTYAKLVGTLPSGKVKRTTLKTQLLPGSDLPNVQLAPAVFGRDAKQVTVEPGSLFAFRITRALTNSTIWQAASITMGVVSAGIAASFAIGDKMSQPWVVVSSDTVFVTALIGAGLAAVAPFMRLISDKWFNDNDVPN